MDTSLHELLKNCRLFSEIDNELLNRLIEDQKLVFVNEGKILFRRGQDLQKVFLIQSGEVNHFVEKEPGNTNVVVYKSNDLIFPPEFFDHDKFISTAIAVRDTFLVEIKKADIEDLISKSNELKESLKKHLMNLTGRKFEQPSLSIKTKEAENISVQNDKNEKSTLPSKTENVKNEEISTEMNASDDSDLIQKLNKSSKFRIEKNEDIFEVTVTLSDATFESAAEIKKTLLELVDNRTINLLVDISFSNLIDSTFLGALVITLKKVNAQKGKFALVRSNKPAWMIFEMTGLANVFTSFENKEEARKFFKN